jgi:hypothetical protein
MKEVKKAAKKAKAFETQKIVKKLKALGFVCLLMGPSSGVINYTSASLGKEDTERSALETELDALKVRPRYSLKAFD